MLADLSDLFGERRRLTVRQLKEWTEIVLEWETRNRYTILDPRGQELGWVVERANAAAGFLRRGFLGSHRPFEIRVVDPSGGVLMRLERDFFFLFSDLDVVDGAGRRIGRVRRRFGVTHRRYDLADDAGHVFARIRSPRWRLWTFPVFDLEGAQRAIVSKAWGGGLREAFTDADTYVVDFGATPWSVSQRAVIFAAAVSIDFDFFENNQRGGELVDETVDPASEGCADTDADGDFDFDFD